MSTRSSTEDERLALSTRLPAQRAGGGVLEHKEESGWIGCDGPSVFFTPYHIMQMPRRPMGQAAPPARPERGKVMSNESTFSFRLGCARGPQTLTAPFPPPGRARYYDADRNKGLLVKAVRADDQLMLSALAHTSNSGPDNENEVKMLQVRCAARCAGSQHRAGERGGVALLCWMCSVFSVMPLLTRGTSHHLVHVLGSPACSVRVREAFLIVGMPYDVQSASPVGEDRISALDLIRFSFLTISLCSGVPI